MFTGYELLSALRINRVINALQDVRELPGDLVFLNRTKVNYATEGEVIGRFIGRIQIADLVADDSRAVTYDTGKVSFETTPLPNLKIGRTLNQEQLAQMNSIMANPGLQNPGPIAAKAPFFNSERNIISDLMTGIEWRMEALLVAMACDSLSYDRLGIKLSNATWGMPTDLKVTTANPWTDATNGTPIQDILSMQLTARVRYGISYNRVTMSTSAFQKAILTADFTNRARLMYAPYLPSAPLPVQQIPDMQRIFETLTGCQVVLYDSRYWFQDAAGVPTSAPFLPTNKVILDSSTNDKRGDVQDFASTDTVESTIGQMITSDNVIGRIESNAPRPIAYATITPDLNPPNITYWSVARGFPRKFRLQANACLTVGTIPDVIPVGEPF